MRASGGQMSHPWSKSLSVGFERRAGRAQASVRPSLQFADKLFSESGCCCTSTMTGITSPHTRRQTDMQEDTGPHETRQNDCGGCGNANITTHMAGRQQQRNCGGSSNNEEDELKKQTM